MNCRRIPERPLVSIVIPVFNQAAYVRTAIASVLTQSYYPIELIVLDDGSTDQTASLLREYREGVRWETHKNMGQAATLNKGWQMSKGEVISYLSADDMLKPDAVGVSVRHLSASPEAVLTYCDFDLMDSESRLIRRVKAPRYDYQRMLADLICPPGPGVFLPRWAFDSAGGWDPGLRQMPDLDYWLRLGLHGPFLHIEQSLAAFRVHSSSQTFSRTDEARAAEPIRIVSRFFEDHTDRPDLSFLRNRAQCSAYLFSAQLHLRAGRPKMASECFKKALLLCPSQTMRMRTIRATISAIFSRPFHRILRMLRGAFSD